MPRASGNVRASKHHATKRRSAGTGGTRNKDGTGQRQQEVRRVDRRERGDAR